MKRRKIIMKVILLLACVALTSCERQVKSEGKDNKQSSYVDNPKETRQTPAQIPGDSIRSIDFTNFEYDFNKFSQYFKETKIKLTDGETEFGRSTIYFDTVLYMEVTGDTTEDAAVVIRVKEGSGSDAYVFLFTMKEDKPKLLWRLGAGDRAHGGLRNIYEEKGDLIIEQYIPLAYFQGKEIRSAWCCPMFYERKYHKWNGKDFKQTKKERIQNESEKATIEYISNLPDTIKAKRQ